MTRHHLVLRYYPHSFYMKMFCEGDYKHVIVKGGEHGLDYFHTSKAKKESQAWNHAWKCIQVERLNKK